MDAAILRVMSNREQYEALSPQIQPGTFHKNTELLLKYFGKWFQNSDEDKINIEAFKNYFFSFANRQLSLEEQQYFNKSIDNIAADFDEKSLHFIEERLISLTFATQIGNLLQQYNDGQELDIVHLVGERHDCALSRLNAKQGPVHIEDDIDTFLDEDECGEGLKFETEGLRHLIRPLRASDFVIVAGRPDTGKTSFITSQLCSFVQQLPPGRPILWFNNEGCGRRIIKRIYQSVLQDTVDGLLQRKRGGTLHNDYESRLGNRESIRVVDCHQWQHTQVERAINYYNPGLVIFDMIDNIEFTHIKSDDRTDQALEKMYQWARTLGVLHDCPIIATSQVSGEADMTRDTQMWPTQRMLKDSKTGKQGAADLIIMLGRNQEETDKRYISTPKNKLARSESYIKSVVSFDSLRGVYG